MSDLLAIDIDGTLLDYNYNGPVAVVNPKVALSLPRRIALVTNQGGTSFGVAGILRSDGRPYPRPGDFVGRLSALLSFLSQSRVEVIETRISVYHPRADLDHIQMSARAIRLGLATLKAGEWRVYATERARKPNPLMLRSVRATEYWGDSDEDEAAAAAAGITFRRVARFVR